MRLLPILASLAAISCAGPRQDAFVPTARQTFSGFIALDPPREFVPVGAEWIAGQGSSGAGARPDQLEVVRSLSSVVIDRKLQGEASMSLFKLLGLAPKGKRETTARFTDLTIVRLKDPGPSLPDGRRRILEALKARSFVISSSADQGLAVSGIAPTPLLKVDASASRARSDAIEGKDLFIAVRLGE